MANDGRPDGPVTIPGMARPESPLDLAARELIDRAKKANPDRGFVFEVGKNAEDASAVAVTVKAAPVDHDEWEAPTPLRAHEMGDTESFLAFAKKYGKPEKSLVVFNDEQAVLVLDELKERGDRERITREFTFSDPLVAWRALLDKAHTHKDLLRSIILLSHTLVEPDVLVSMRTVKASATMKFDSDIKDMGEEQGVVLITSGGETMANFPKAFEVRVPILDEDLLKTQLHVTLKIALSPVFPDEARQPLRFLLVCHELAALIRERIDTEAAAIRQALEGWTVVRGEHKCEKRRLGKAAE